MLRQSRWLFLITLALLPSGCARQAAVQTNPDEQAADQTAAIAWSYDYEAALALAEEQNKPLMVDFFATWCKFCKMLDAEVFSRPDVGEASRDFVCVKVDGDKHPDVKEKLGVSGYPTVVFLASDGSEIRRSRGFVSHTIMLREMAAAAEQAGAPEAESG